VLRAFFAVSIFPRERTISSCCTTFDGAISEVKSVATGCTRRSTGGAASENTSKRGHSMAAAKKSSRKKSSGRKSTGRKKTARKSSARKGAGRKKAARKSSARKSGRKKTARKRR
jgi:hypothetical protein